MFSHRQTFLNPCASIIFHGGKNDYGHLFSTFRQGAAAAMVTTAAAVAVAAAIAAAAFNIVVISPRGPFTDWLFSFSFSLFFGFFRTCARALSLLPSQLGV